MTSGLATAREEEMLWVKEVILLRLSAQAAETPPHTPWLKQQRFLSPGSGGCRSEVQVLAGLVLPEASHLDL